MWMRVKPNYTVCISGTSPPLMGNPSQQHDPCLSRAAGSQNGLRRRTLAGEEIAAPATPIYSAAH